MSPRFTILNAEFFSNYGLLIPHFVFLLLSSKIENHRPKGLENQMCIYKLCAPSDIDNLEKLPDLLIRSITAQ